MIIAKFWRIFSVFVIWTLAAQHLSAQVEADAISSKKTVTASDGLSQLTIPANWRTNLKVNDYATLQVANKPGELFVIIITTSKEDFQDVTLEEKARTTQAELLSALRDSTISEGETIEADGKRCLQYRIAGSTKDIEVEYLLTVIEGERFHYSIIAWSLKSQFSGYLEKAQQIVRTFRAIEDVQTFHEAVEATRLVLATDTLSQINVPFNWSESDELSDNASLQVVSPRNDAFLMVITEGKGDSSETTLDGYAQLAVERIVEGLNDSTISEPVHLQIDGQRAVRYEIRAKMEQMGLRFWHISVEGESYYYQLYAWTLQSKYESYKDQFETIFETFKTSENLEDKWKSSVWIVEGKTNTLFLAGSIHLLNERDYPLNPPFVTAYEQADVLVFEINPDSMKTSQFQQYTLSKGLFTGDETLQTNISPELFKSFEDELLKSGFPIHNFLKFRPWFAAMTLTVLKLKALGLEQQYGLDLHFFEKAKSDGKEVRALETPVFQIDLFANMDVQTSEQFLAVTVEQVQKAEMIMAPMLEAWKYGMVDKLNSLMNKELKKIPGLYEIFIRDRNKLWLVHIENLINGDNNVMVVVGVGHMVGEASVVELLRERGYTVRQL